ISQPIDFLGLNIYNGKYVSAKNGVSGNPQGFPRTAIGWPITPEALYWGPKFMFERYGKPIIITENGMACHDAVSLDGKVHDPNRIDYFNRYLREYKRAADDGVRLDGYYVWSLTDNFEWGHGYNQRFGLTFIDYNTQKRIIKDSGMFIRSVIESNGENL
ncbi:MAG: family 1 glycosylhydrolase, partial [Ruminiclostridium sp.]|nr:family 1 glycosylhydrolase [Ruminiclostridium sp.]